MGHCLGAGKFERDTGPAVRQLHHPRAVRGAEIIEQPAVAEEAEPDDVGRIGAGNVILVERPGLERDPAVRPSDLGEHQLGGLAPGGGLVFGRDLVDHLDAAAAAHCPQGVLALPQQDVPSQAGSRKIG